MAGAGYKLFNTGDVLTAAQVNTYLQEQAVMRFANATARTTALSGVLAEGMVSYLDDTNALEVYNGSAWVGAGSSGDIEGVTAGTGISGGGTSGTVTITNSMATAIDAKGDLIVGTGADTFARLAVGTNGYTLVADSGETTGLKWAAASSGALVLVKRGTFSNVANTGTTFDDVFTSTYVSYLLNFEFVSASTTANDLEMLLRNTGGTSRTANYKSASGRLTAGATTSTYYGAANDDFWQLTQDTYGGGYLFFNRTNSSLQGFYYSEANMAWYAIQLQNGAGGGSIGFQLRSSSSNITGQISVYGLAQS